MNKIKGNFITLYDGNICSQFQLESWFGIKLFLFVNYFKKVVLQLSDFRLSWDQGKYCKCSCESYPLQKLLRMAK